MAFTMLIGFFVQYQIQKVLNDKYDIHPNLNLLGFIIGLPLSVGVVLFIQASISYFVL